MAKVKSFLSVFLMLTLIMSSIGTTVFAAGYNSETKDYDVGEGIIITSTNISVDKAVVLTKNNVQYDTGSKKKGTIAFDSFSDNIYEQVMAKVFGEKHTYEGVIDYVGSGQSKNTLTIPINISDEKNYYVYVLASSKDIFMWIDNPTATTAGDTVGSITPSGRGTMKNTQTDKDKISVAYVIDCGKLTPGKHTITFDGAKGAWCPDICAVAVYPATAADFEGPTPAYQDESLPYEKRAADLVSRMTLEQKIAQLGHNASAIADLSVGKYYYWKEAVHGIARQGKATSFPSSVSVANSWDPEMMRREASIISAEGRMKNNRYDLNYWSPTINMQRDPRWGRNEESFSEDTYLTSIFGEQFVKGMQYGMEENGKYKRTIPTLKHFLANNNEGERQRGTSIMTEEELRNYYTAAFRNVVESSDPGAVMSSYNATTVTRKGEKLWDYIASPANRNTLTDLLRKNWGFNGFVTGDCGAVADLFTTQAFKEALYESEKDGMFKDLENFTKVPQSATVALGIKAGNELDCGGVSQGNALEAVEEGYLSEDELDVALYRIFLERFKTGEFDNNDEANAFRAQFKDSDLESDASVAVAEEASEKGIVLLQNKEGTDGKKLLPLDKNSNKKIVIFGNLASKAYLGDYSGTPFKSVSPYEGIKEMFGDANVQFPTRIPEGTKIFDDIESIILVKTNNEEVDLSKATIVNGAVKSDGKFTNVESGASMIIPNVNFSGVKEVKIKAKLSEGSLGGSVQIGYDDVTPIVADVNIAPNKGENGMYTAKYSGNDGGYNKTADMYISIDGNPEEFSVSKYKNELDSADVIIAYAGTISSSEKQADGELTDGKESNDRSTISLPSRDNHVSEICNYKEGDSYPYADKTVVVMQTVGQVDVDSFEEHCRAILWTCYNGQCQGTALAKVLSGDVNPSGKLTTTWYNPNDLVQGKLQCGVDRVTDSKNGASMVYYYDDQYRLAPKDASDTYPGRTYMYYRGEPQYPFGYGLSYTDFEYSNIRTDNSSLKPGDTFKVTVNVKNNGSVAGREVVQIYVKNDEKGNGFDLPLQQLVGFGSVELNAGEAKDVEITVDTKLLSHYSEEIQKNYTPNGNYTLWAGKYVTDNAHKTTFSITGEQESKIKTVYAIPNGITVRGAYDSSTKTTQAINTIVPELSAVMTDEEVYNLENAEITYTSDNENIAKIDNNGNVIPGTESGVANITIAVKIGSETKEVSFPVVCKLQKAISAEIRQPYLDELDMAYGSYNQSDYREDFWANLTGIYNKAKSSINLEVDESNLKIILDKAKKDMAAIRSKLKDGDEAYTVTFADDQYYWNTIATIAYNGDEDNPIAKTMLAVFDENGVMKNVINKDCEATMNKNDVINIDNLDEGDVVKCYVWDSLEKMNPLAATASTTIIKPPAHMEYDISDPIYDRFLVSSGIKVEEINGVGGYGDLSRDDKSSKNLSITYNNKTYKPKVGLLGTKGTMTKSNIYFKPFDCYEKATVTVLYTSAAPDRKLEIVQNNEVLKTDGGAGDSTLKALTVETTDLKNPVYVKSGSASQKVTVYMIIVDYDGYKEKPTILEQSTDVVNVKGENDDYDEVMTAMANSSYLSVTPEGKITRIRKDKETVFDYNKENKTSVRFLKVASWNNESFVALVEDNETKERKVILSSYGTQWSEPAYVFTPENNDLGTDLIPSINDFITAGDQIYVGCDDGLMVVITPCVKCYRLMKVCDFDIKNIDREENVIKFKGKTINESASIPLSSIRQTNISVDEALNMRGSGALFIDVRDPEEYDKEKYDDSINIPLSNIDKINEYPKDSVLIFYCSTGTRAVKAVEYAQKNGFTNVYNLGSVSSLMELK